MGFGGQNMDNFIDKIAQKLGSGELISANASAEAKEMRRMKEKLEEYETLVQQMRQVHLKNVELLGRMQTTVDALEQFEDAGLEDDDQLNGYTAEDVEELKKKLDAAKDAIDNSNRSLADLIHTEDVKVFRNVEAVVLEGFEKQEKKIFEENVSVKKKMRGVKPLAITTLVLVALQFLGMAIWAVDYFFNLGIF